MVKLSGNRRRPYGARITIERDERGYPVYKFLSYHAKREDAIMALALYNKDPYDVEAAKITLRELYEKWLERAEQQGKLSKSSVGSIKAAFKHCKTLHGNTYKSIKAFMMQSCIDNCGKSYSTQGAIKTMWLHLDKFALELDIIQKMYSELITSAPIPPTSKIPFTDEEVDLLWKHADEPWVDTILIFMYSGWRINELLGMKREDVNMEAGTMKGGLKTKSGIGRLVPVHSKVFDMVKRRYDEGGKYLLSVNGKKVSQSQYYIFWHDIMNRLGIVHNGNSPTPHECRHTFRSRLDSANGNRACVNRLMGHVSSDVGLQTYTHKTIDELRKTIELIKN